MKSRTFWLKKIEDLWKEKSLVWLSGVRRAGKTLLSQSLNNVEFFDCELPRVRRMLEDPESFLDGLQGKRIVLDEIHRLHNPSELLKIATDHYPSIKVVATGSSTLGASRKFKDTLTGRKRELWLTPIMSQDIIDFDGHDLSHRFLFGGLPPFYLSTKLPEADFQEWMDAFWSKDIQELFRLERKYSFQKFIELILSQSGGIFEATSFAAPCEVNRKTIANYLKVLESTFVAHTLRPFHSHEQTEIVSAPKVYGFDTGFVCYFKGWYALRRTDMGELWEHYVLNELHAQLQSRRIHYWRDKQGHEVDFVIKHRNKDITAIECKWSSQDFNPRNLAKFSKQYPHARLYLVAHDIDRRFQKTLNNTRCSCVSLSHLVCDIKKSFEFGNS